MPRIEHPEKTLHFVGGPHDGETITVLWQRNRDAVYRSGIKGDDTMYGYRGVNSHRYYFFFNVWRWEGLDSFDHLIITDQSEVCELLTIDLDVAE